jgi:ATP-binding cassette, subfamily G (WHITE), member 2, PDR
MLSQQSKQATTTSNEFASSFLQQLFIVTKRNFEHDWRTPAYLYSKVSLTIGAVGDDIAH